MFNMCRRRQDPGASHVAFSAFLEHIVHSLLLCNIYIVHALHSMYFCNMRRRYLDELGALSEESMSATEGFIDDVSKGLGAFWGDVWGVLCKCLGFSVMFCA